MIEHRHCDCCVRARYETCCVCKQPTALKHYAGSPVIEAADALAKAAKISTAVSVSHDNSREETRTVEVWEKEFLDLKEALAAYEKVRGMK